jgi:hypothetical protein
MALPTPEPGLVIAFNYLWKRERDLGRDNARYPRPCAIVLTMRRAADGQTVVMVCPITHTSPSTDVRALLLPARVKQSLGLDDAPSWVITDEVNEFVWPGFDLARNEKGEVAYGLLPPRLFDRIRESLLEAARASALAQTLR